MIISSSSPCHTALISHIELNTLSLTVFWQDDSQSEYHYLWLRDNCPSAFHAKTGERDFDLLSVSPDIHPIHYTNNEDSLTINWSEGQHTSHFSNHWLKQHSYSNTSDHHQSTSYLSWDCSFKERIPSADYHAVVEQDSALLNWMQELDKYGLTIIDNMPNETAATETLATRIDYLRRTNFGTMFDVVSVESPINLAYTAIALPLHTDLPNQETPPGYQFLHCLANDSEGGESIFVDGLKVAEELRKECPDHFKLLCDHAIPFHFHDEDHDILHHHPIINLDNFGNIVEIKYNAHLATVFDLPADIMYDYYLAYRNLMARFRDERFKIEFKLQAGQMVVFDNRRVLHGRNTFEDTRGRRHLHGCYVDRTEFKSRLKTLSKKILK